MNSDHRQHSFGGRSPASPPGSRPRTGSWTRRISPQAQLGNARGIARRLPRRHDRGRGLGGQRSGEAKNRPPNNAGLQAQQSSRRQELQHRVLLTDGRPAAALFALNTCLFSSIRCDDTLRPSLGTSSLRGCHICKVCVSTLGESPSELSVYPRTLMTKVAVDRGES